MIDMNTTPTMLNAEVVVTPIAFRDVPIGAQFWWGSYLPKRMNWGRKRSNRTADWCPVVNGELTNCVDWGYWKATETVYIIH